VHRDRAPRIQRGASERRGRVRGQQPNGRLRKGPPLADPRADEGRTALSVQDEALTYPDRVTDEWPDPRSAELIRDAPRDGSTGERWLVDHRGAHGSVGGERHRDVASTRRSARTLAARHVHSAKGHCRGSTVERRCPDRRGVCDAPLPGHEVHSDRASRHITGARASIPRAPWRACRRHRWNLYAGRRDRRG
jgi:hypothetical protein